MPSLSESRAVGGELGADDRVGPAEGFELGPALRVGPAEAVGPALGAVLGKALRDGPPEGWELGWREVTADGPADG